MTANSHMIETQQPPAANHRYWKSGILIFLVCMIGLSLLGKFSFYSWQQVLDLYSYGLPFDALYGHPHFFRYLVAYPGLHLANLYGEEWFSVYIVFFMTLSIYLMYYLLREGKSGLIFLSCASVFILHIFMNGRGAISWLGWMLIVYVMFTNTGQKEKIINTPILILALLLCSVSSGTFSVAYITVILFYTYKFFKHFKLLNFDILLRISIPFFISYLYYDLFMSGINRNLDYYRLGSRNIIYNMLEHGFGSFVLEHPLYIAIMLISLLIILSYLFFALDRKPTILEFIVIGVPLAGGIFGYTTMTLAIPSLFLVVFARLGGVDLFGREQLHSLQAMRN